MKVLVSGPAGSGKTTLSKFFSKKGKVAIDTDTAGIGIWLDLDGKQVKGAPYINAQTNEWSEKNDLKWNWDEKKLKRLLKRSGEIYIFGSAWNIGEFFGMFDRKYFLDANERLILERIGQRNKYAKNYNDWGRTESQRRKIIGILGMVRQRALKGGFQFVDASLPKEQIFEIICKQ